jgi:hypothetical protein
MWGDCEHREAASLAAANGAGPRERAAIEAHAKICADCADALRNIRSIDTALRGAFAPLRERRTIIAPGRVRLAVGARASAPNVWLDVPRWFGRLTKVSVMFAATLFAIGGSLEFATPQSVPPAATHSVIQNYFRSQPHGESDSLRWLRLVKTNDFSTASDTMPIPLGGRF